MEPRAHGAQLFTAAALLFLAVANFACASSGTRVTPEMAQKLVVGETTQQEIFAILGDPQDVDINENGDRVFSYNYVQSSPMLINYLASAAAIAGGADGGWAYIASSAVGGTNIKADKTRIIVGKDGILKDIISLNDLEGQIKTGLNAD